MDQHIGSINLQFVTTNRLIEELEQRERLQPGAWTGQQAHRLLVLARKLNPEPINP